MAENFTTNGDALNALIGWDLNIFIVSKTDSRFSMEITSAAILCASKKKGLYKKVKNFNGYG